MNTDYVENILINSYKNKLQDSDVLNRINNIDNIDDILLSIIIKEFNKITSNDEYITFLLKIYGYVLNPNSKNMKQKVLVKNKDLICI